MEIDASKIRVKVGGSRPLGRGTAPTGTDPISRGDALLSVGARPNYAAYQASNQAPEDPQSVPEQILRDGQGPATAVQILAGGPQALVAGGDVIESVASAAGKLPMVAESGLTWLGKLGSTVSGWGEGLAGAIGDGSRFASVMGATASGLAKALPFVQDGVAVFDIGHTIQTLRDPHATVGQKIQSVATSGLATISGIAGTVALFTPPPIDAIAGGIAIGTGIASAVAANWGPISRAATQAAGAVANVAGKVAGGVASAARSVWHGVTSLFSGW